MAITIQGIYHRDRFTAEAGKPGPSNTGVPAGVTLTAYTGPSNITTPGTTIDSKDISTNLTINASNVTIKNCKIHGTLASGVIGIDNGNGYNLILTDCEIYNFWTGLVYGGWTGIRLNMHDLSYDGIKMSSGATLRDSWIHDPQFEEGAHWDAIQIQDGVTNVTIQHNVIDVGTIGSDALFFAPDLGPSTNGPVLIDGNWFNGGNYTISILDGNNGVYFVQNITVTNNRWGRTSNYGPCNRNVPITQSGNVWDDDNTSLIL